MRQVAGTELASERRGFRGTKGSQRMTGHGRETRSRCGWGCEKVNLWERDSARKDRERHATQGKDGSKKKWFLLVFVDGNFVGGQLFAY